MALHDRIAYLRTEHAKLLELAENVAGTLALASSTNFPKRQKCLARLRTFDHAFDGVAEHCHAENRIVESVYESEFTNEPPPRRCARSKSTGEKQARDAKSHTVHTRWSRIPNSETIVGRARSIAKIYELHCGEG